MNLKIIIIAVISFVSFAVFSQDIRLDASVSHKALIYPNPCYGETIQIKSQSDMVKVEVVDVIGKVISRVKNENLQKHFAINIDNCEKGLYLIKITFNDKRSIIKKLLVK